MYNLNTTNVNGKRAVSESEIKPIFVEYDKYGNLRFSEIPQWRRKLPIPQDQIDINERLSQNEGY